MWYFGRFVDCLVDYLIGRLVGLLAGRLVGWFVDNGWFVGWFSCWFLGLMILRVFFCICCSLGWRMVFVRWLVCYGVEVLVCC